MMSQKMEHHRSTILPYHGEFTPSHLPAMPIILGKGESGKTHFIKNYPDQIHVFFRIMATSPHFFALLSDGLFHGGVNCPFT